MRRILRLLAVCALILLGITGTQRGAATAATSTCTVDYSIVNSWPGGFQAGITITNDGPAVSSWSLAFYFPDDQVVSGGWNGTFSQQGQVVEVTSESYNGSLATGDSASIGFTGTVGATDDVPTSFWVNGYSCNGAAQVPFTELTSPAPDADYAPGANVSLTADASEATASITQVSFYATSVIPGTSQTPVLLGSATTSPYTLTWADIPAGYYNITAEATDSAGATETSPPILTSVVSTTSTAPQVHVSGNELVNASGKPVVLHGVDRSGGEFSCVQDTGIWNGPMDQASVTAMKEWGITAVRIPLNEACWNGESYVPAAYAGANYQQAVEAYVNLLNDNGIVAILDLHWTDGAYSGTGSGCASAESICQKPMPDAAEAIPFWTSVATAFNGNNAVIFDLFNEPYPDFAAETDGAPDYTEGWQCWLNGGTCTGIGYQVAGMQSMVNAVRSTGASNVLMLGGLSWSNYLQDWQAYEPVDPDHNLVASWHSYNFNTCSTESCWTSQVAPVAASVPVIAGEIGENDCSDTYITPLMSWLDSESISYLAWTWNTWGCSEGNVLIQDYDGTPTPYGAGYEAHLQELAGG
jgi:endoglucanase